MGLFGTPYTVPYGGHEEFLKTCEIKDIGSGARVRFEAHTGYEQFDRLVIDGVKLGVPTYTPAGKPVQLTGPYPGGGTGHVVSVCPQGDWATPDIDVSAQQINFQSARSNRIHGDIVAQPRLFGTGLSGQLTFSGTGTNSATGLKRFINCRPHQRCPTWGVMDITLTDSAGTRTVTGKLNGVTLMSGSRVGNGAITLTAANDSGLTLACNVTYTGDVTSGGLLVAEFPAQLKVHYKINSNFGGGDFPRTAEKTLYDDGYLDKYVFRSDPITPGGTYYALAHQVDPQGNEGTGTGGTATTVNSPPNAPGTPVYTSGNHSNTVITFTAAGASDTYNIYDSLDTGQLGAMETATTTRAAGTGSLTKQLDALSNVTFTGIRYVVVRSVSSGGIEEGNLKVLAIEYLSGTVVTLRPPYPGCGDISRAGLTLTVNYIVSTAEQKTAATHIRLYVWNENGGSPSYGTPDASAAIATAVGKTINGSVSFAVGGAGSYKFALRTYSNVTSEESDNVEVFGPVHMTTTAPDAPQSQSFYTGV